MQSLCNTVVPGAISPRLEEHRLDKQRLSERVMSKVRGPWGRPLAKAGLVLGTVVFLSWLGARSAASNPPPVGDPDSEIAMLAAGATPSEGSTTDVGTKESAPVVPSNEKPDPVDVAKASPPLVGVLPDGRVVINAATSEELCRLPGVGPARAEKILELRKRLGGFRSARQLLRVKGIGPKTLKRLTPLFVLDAPVQPTPQEGG